MSIRIAEWVKAIIVIGVIVLAYLVVNSVTHTIGLFAAGGIIAYLLNPIVGRLEQRGLKRGLAIPLSYLLVLLIFVFIGVVIVPPLTESILTFAGQVPDYIERLQQAINDSPLLRNPIRPGFIQIEPSQILDRFADILTGVVNGLIALIPSTITFVFDAFLIFIISIYFLSSMPRMYAAMRNTLPTPETKQVLDEFNRAIRYDLGRYLIGQLVVMLIIGFLIGAGMWLIGLPNPIIFGFWAFLTEIIPYVGPVLGAIPAVLIAFTVSPFTALLVVGFFVLMQLLESNILSPRILGKSIEANPLLVLFFIVAGGELAGIYGILLAVPVLVVIKTLFRFVYQNFQYDRSGPGLDRVLVIKKRRAD